MNNSPNLPNAESDGISAEADSPSLGDAIDMEKSTVGEATSTLLRLFNYSASLPERTLRSASALAGGIVRESANWLVPSAFRNSKSYSIFVQQMLTFAINDIGGVRKIGGRCGLERPLGDLSVGNEGGGDDGRGEDEGSGNHRSGMMDF